MNGLDWFAPKRTVFAPEREGSVHSEEDDFLRSEEDDFLRSEEVTGFSLG